MPEVFKVDETGFLLKERDGNYIVFRGKLEDLKAYRRWYKGANRNDFSIIDHNVFIVTREVGRDET